MNPNVSQTNCNGRFFRSIAPALGLFQGGEFVTMRATETVRGTFQRSTHRLMTQPAPRDVAGFPVEHPREVGSIFSEVRRRGKEGLLE